MLPDVLNAERIVTTAGLVGTIELALKLATDYASERKVFGNAPIAAQACADATERAIQTMGGMGYSREMHVERLWRDCRLFRFAPRRR